MAPRPFVPAKAGTQTFWIPAFAGMNGNENACYACEMNLMFM